MTEVDAATKPRLIIAAVVFLVSSLLCCGCLATAWFFGDVLLDQFSATISLFAT